MEEGNGKLEVAMVDAALMMQLIEEVRGLAICIRLLTQIVRQEQERRLDIQFLANNMN